MSKEKKEDEPKISEAQYEAIRKTALASRLLAHDIDEGISMLSIEIAMALQGDTAKANAMTDKVVSFLIGLNDEVRYFVLNTLREIHPGVSAPDMDRLAARKDYVKLMDNLPKTATLLQEMNEKIEAQEKEAKEGPPIRVVKVSGDRKELILKLLSSLVEEEL